MKLLFRCQQPVEDSPCGFAFDEEKGQVVIAQYGANGGFEIRRSPQMSGGSLTLPPVMCARAYQDGTRTPAWRNYR